MGVHQTHTEDLPEDMEVAVVVEDTGAEEGKMRPQNSRSKAVCITLFQP